MWIALALLGCRGEEEPLDVRQELDSPTAQLTADLIPQVVDDFARNVDTYQWENKAFALIDLARGGQARSAPLDLGPDVPQDQFIGGAICAVGFIAELASFETCDAGTECEAELTFNSCLMSDKYAKGKMHFRVRGQSDAEVGRGALEIEFDRFRSDGTLPHEAVEIDGLLGVEAAMWNDRDREEIVYTADFRTRTLDMARRSLFGGGVMEDIHVRAGMRLAIETTEGNEETSVEMLAYVDDDGDGIPTASVVLRLKIEELEGGLLEGLTLEIEGAGGGWSCTFAQVEKSSTDSGFVSWTSSGECTDPDGNAVSFSGTVDDD